MLWFECLLYTWFPDQLLQQVSEMVNSGEMIDASTNLIPPDLLTHLPTTTDSGSMSQRTQSSPTGCIIL